MEEVEDSKRCTSIKRDGERCNARRMGDGLVCSLHSAKGQEIRAKAVQASVEARQAKVRERKEAVEVSRMTLGEALAVEAGKRVQELVQALVQRAVDGDMAAQRIVWDRREGKVIDRIEVSETSPVDMDAGTLAKWLAETEAE